MDKKQLKKHLPTEGQGRDEMIKFYSWSFEDAWAAQEAWQGVDTHIKGRGPFFRWIGAGELQGLYEIYRKGNKAAVIEALYVCSLNSLPIPRWCEMAYLSAYRKIKHYKAKSWDDVFGRPHPKGTHLETKKQEREFAFKVYNRIEQIKRDDPSTPIDGYLFERIGREFGIGGKTLTEGYYYKEKNFRKNLNSKYKNKLK